MVARITVTISNSQELSCVGRLCRQGLEAETQTPALTRFIGLSVRRRDCISMTPNVPRHKTSDITRLDPVFVAGQQPEGDPIATAPPEIHLKCGHGVTAASTLPPSLPYNYS